MGTVRTEVWGTGGTGMKAGGIWGSWIQQDWADWEHWGQRGFGTVRGQGTMTGIEMWGHWRDLGGTEDGHGRIHDGGIGTLWVWGHGGTRARGWGVGTLGMALGGPRRPRPFLMQCPCPCHVPTVSSCVPQAPAPLSTVPWAPRCCCHARGVRPSGAGVTPPWARPQPRGWPCPTPAWPTRATTAATTLSPVRPGPPSACGWAVSAPPALL